MSYFPFYQNILLTALYPNFQFHFQDLLNTLKPCLSCVEAFQYAQYVSTFIYYLN